MWKHRRTLIREEATVAREVSIEWKSVRVSVAVGALVALGCTSRGDPKPIDIRDFSTAAHLNDSLTKLVPVGTSVPRAQAVMVQSGFKCDVARYSAIAVVNGKLGSGPPTLECWNSNRIFPGLQHRDWTVVYRYDSAGVRDVTAWYIIQP
jgi:hypothetical protein